MIPPPPADLPSAEQSSRARLASIRAPPTAAGPPARFGTPAPPASVPLPAASVLAQGGMPAELISRYSAAFERMKGLENADPALLRSFAGSQAAHGVENVKKIDLAVFASAVEERKRTSWKEGFGKAREELQILVGEKGGARAKALKGVLKENAGVDVTEEEAEAMIPVLDNEQEFLAAMEVSKLPRTQPSIATNMKTGALPFFDGKGDPRNLPVASPKLAESRFPPPTPPPLPSS